MVRFSGMLSFVIIVFLSAGIAASQTIPNPGHSPSEIGPGTFYGSGTWTFPGNVVASGTICGTDGCAGEGGGEGGTCACPWTSQSWGLQYTGTAGVTGNLRAQQICDENGANCKDISAGWSTGGTSYWSPATLAGTSGIAYNGYIGAAKYCDTTGTTCKSINEMGGAATCDCPSIWTEPSSGRTYYMGNVGIGTSSAPNAKLQVYQDSTHWISLDPYYLNSYNVIRSGGTLYFRVGDADYTQYFGSGTMGTNQLALGYHGTATLTTYDSNENLVIDPNGVGGVGIGKTPASGIELDVAGDIRANTICDNSGHCIGPAAASIWSQSGSVVSYNSGRVEIGYTGDASGATNTGALEIGNSLRLDTNEVITNSGTTLYLQSDNNGDLNVDSNTLFVDASANRVGIRTTAPEGPLDVRVSGNNQILFREDNNVGLELRSETSGGTPYIDFANDAGSDYDARIRLTGNDQLSVEGAEVHADAYCDSTGTDCMVPGEFTSIILFTLRYTGSPASFSTDGSTRVLFTDDPADKPRNVQISSATRAGAGHYKLRVNFNRYYIDSDEVIMATFMQQDAGTRKLTLSDSDGNNMIEFMVSDDASANDLIPGDEITFMVAWPPVGLNN